MGVLTKVDERRAQIVGAPLAAQGEVHAQQKLAQRCAELVAGVGDQPALALDAGLHTREQVVEGLREACKLVAGLGHRQAKRGVGRLRARAAAHALDRIQRHAGDAVADDPRDQQGAGEGDRELDQQLAQRFVAVAFARPDLALVRARHISMLRLSANCIRS